MGGYRLTDPDTSRRAYEDLEQSGLLSRIRLEVCAALAKRSPVTAGELGVSLNSNRNNVATRLSELECTGVVEKVFEKPCPTSGRTCWTWQLTGGLPRGEPLKPASRVKGLESLAKQLERENNELRERLVKMTGCLFCGGKS